MEVWAFFSEQQSFPVLQSSKDEIYDSLLRHSHSLPRMLFLVTTQECSTFLKIIPVIPLFFYFLCVCVSARPVNLTMASSPWSAPCRNLDCRDSFFPFCSIVSSTSCDGVYLHRARVIQPARTRAERRLFRWQIGDIRHVLFHFSPH